MIVKMVRGRGHLRGGLGGLGPEGDSSAFCRSGLTGPPPDRCLPYTRPLGFGSAIGGLILVASSAPGRPGGIGRAPGPCGN